MRLMLLPLLAAITVAASPGWTREPSSPSEQQDLQSALEAMAAGRSPLSPALLEKAIRQAEQHPLGSRENPVRASQPQGQRAYLATLRCSDGSTPRYMRAGNAGMGVYQSIIDVYQVDCGNAAPGRVSVYMDMYHRGHVETRAVPGFTVATQVAPDSI